MKKTLSLFCALLLSLSLVLSSVQAEEVLVSCFQKVSKLLFETENVTVDGEAKFFFDESRFKTAKLHCVREGEDSILDLHLYTPNSDGQEKESGYCVIGQSGFAYISEYNDLDGIGLNPLKPHRSLIRPTAKLDALMKLGFALMPKIEAELGDAIVMSSMEDGGSELHIGLEGEQVPEVLDSCVTLLGQYMGEHYRDMNYANISLSQDVSPEVFITVTNGLLLHTYQLTVEKIDVRITENKEGRLTAFSGSVGLNAVLSNKETRPLEASFQVTISDYGTSVAKQDTPILEKARQALKNAGYQEDLSQLGAEQRVSFADGMGFEIIFPKENSSHPLLLRFNELGRLRVLEDYSAPWLIVNGVVNNKELLYDTPEKLKPLVDRLREWICTINPGSELLLDHVRVDWEWTYENALYVKLYDDESGMDFVVRVQPDFTIQYFSDISNG